MVTRTVVILPSGSYTLPRAATVIGLFGYVDAVNAILSTVPGATTGSPAHDRYLAQVLGPAFISVEGLQVPLKVGTILYWTGATYYINVVLQSPS